MSILQAIVLGIIEGVTEFLPISSTGHLTIAEQAMGFQIDDADITAFTAIIQVGAVAAVLIFLWDDIWKILTSLWRGITEPRSRSTRDFRFGLAIAIGSIPIAIAGLIFRHQIEGSLRNLWVVGTALILWSFVMYAADNSATQRRHEEDFTMRDSIVMGLTQCIALIPGVSRSGATIAAGLFRGLDRVTVTRMSFFLAIPALTAAGVLEAVTKASDISAGIGWGPTLVALAVSFFVAYASVAWLLRYVAGHNFSLFIVYRVLLGVVILALVATGVSSPT
ncbi:MAG: undecaprenyl-diphosphatase [Solirubrobacterales bacterium]|jgi:undecaprenyl-diphosphatase|nr:undecaprenyl-diphosphatase [Solirubrobacterales bacterium]